MVFRIISFLLFAFHVHAATPPTLKEFTDTYQKNLRLQRHALGLDGVDICDPRQTLLKEHVGSVLPLAEFCATQSVYSLFKVQNELSKGKPSAKVLEYILYRGRKYIVDGHHHMLIALYRGDTNIEANLIEKFDDNIPPEEFLKELRKKNLMYDELIDPLRMEASPVLDKVRRLIRDTDIRSGKLVLKGKNLRGPMIGALAPVKPYFAELYMMQVLIDSGRHINNLQPREVLEILQEAKKNKDPRTSFLILLDKPMDIDDRRDFEKATEKIREKAKNVKMSFDRTKCDQFLTENSIEKKEK